MSEIKVGKWRVERCRRATIEYEYHTPVARRDRQAELFARAVEIGRVLCAHESLIIIEQTCETEEEQNYRGRAKRLHLDVKNFRYSSLLVCVIFCYLVFIYFSLS